MWPTQAFTNPELHPLFPVCKNACLNLETQCKSLDITETELRTQPILLRRLWVLNQCEMTIEHAISANGVDIQSSRCIFSLGRSSERIPGNVLLGYEMGRRRNHFK